jgi:signal recognition particle subunit SRP19
MMFLFRYMRRKGLMILWPQYFDRNRPVRLGRRVALKDATNDPTLQDLIEAMKDLGYNYEVDVNAKYPRTWWDEPGYMLIDDNGQKKSAILHKVSHALQKAKKKRQDEAKLDEIRKKYKKKNQMKDALKQKLKSKK